MFNKEMLISKKLLNEDDPFLVRIQVQDVAYATGYDFTQSYGNIYTSEFFYHKSRYPISACYYDHNNGTFNVTWESPLGILYVNEMYVYVPNGGYFLKGRPSGITASKTHMSIVTTTNPFLGVVDGEWLDLYIFCTGWLEPDKHPKDILPIIIDNYIYPGTDKSPACVTYLSNNSSILNPIVFQNLPYNQEPYIFEQYKTFTLTNTKYTYPLGIEVDFAISYSDIHYWGMIPQLSNNIEFFTNSSINNNKNMEIPYIPADLDQLVELAFSGEYALEDTHIFCNVLNKDLGCKLTLCGMYTY